MKKVLITGGTGYIGSHAVVSLYKSGYKPIIIDNLSNSRIEVLYGIKEISKQKPVFYNIDLCDKKALKNFFSKELNIVAVMHFASLKAIGESVKEPLKYYKNNIISTVNLLEELKRNNILNLIFSSSSSLCGQAKKQLVNENSPTPKINSPYENTKKICEDIIKSEAALGKIKAISFRYSNVIGADINSKIGEYPIGKPENLVPFITQTAIGKRKILEVFGDDYNTPDGTCVRDYLHVLDLIDAHIIAIEKLLNNELKNSFEVYNLGAERGVSVMEIIKTFERVNNTKLNYKITERRPGDVDVIYANPKKANNELKWRAKKSIEESLIDAWNWEKALNGF